MTTLGLSPATDEMAETPGVVHRSRSRSGTTSPGAVWPWEPTAPRIVATSTSTRIFERRAPSDDIPARPREELPWRSCLSAVRRSMSTSAR